MGKKYLSLALVAILAASAFGVAADAAEVENEKSGDPVGTIKFDMGDWNHDDPVCFYIWDATDGTYCSKNGWTTNNDWGSKKLRGTKVDGEDGIVESYEIDFTGRENDNIFVIFNDSKSGEQTYDCVLTADALGDTAYMTGNKLENPVDSEKFAGEVKFKNTPTSGAHKTITSTDKIVGDVLAPNESGADIVANYVFNAYGTVDLATGDDRCSAEKVAEFIAAFETNSDDVLASFESIGKNDDNADRYAAIADDVAAVIKGEVAPVNPVDPEPSDPTEPDEPVKPADPETPDQPETPDSPKYGDLDGDGEVSSNDALIILRGSVDLETFTEEQKKQADVDSDGKITSGDSLFVLRYSVDLSTPYPIGEAI